MTLPNGETVTRLRANAGTNVYSAQADDLDWTSPEELALTGVAVEPVTSIESIDGEQIESDFNIYLPYQADVRPLDRMVVRGLTCDVRGARLDWRNPYTGDTPGSVVSVRRVVGASA